MYLNKKDRFFAKARKNLQDELEIVSIIRQLRYVKAAISTLITSQKAFQLKQENDRKLIGKVKKDYIERIELASAPHPITKRDEYQSFSSIQLH